MTTSLDVPPTTDTRGLAAVEARHATWAWGAHVAIMDATFALPPARHTAIIGPNGSGKTTLLRGISGLHPPTSGELFVLGEAARRRPRRVAYVIQSTTVNAALPVTTLDAVRMGRWPHHGPWQRLDRLDLAAVDSAIERLNLEGVRNRQLRELSDGQRQRVFVAQGLAQQADLLLLDEPITGVDLPSQGLIDAALEEETAAGRTVVTTTHDVTGAGRADHVLLLATHVVASGTADEVLTEEHLGHAFGVPAFRTADGALILSDPHVHGAQIRGHDHPDH